MRVPISDVAVPGIQGEAKDHHVLLFLPWPAEEELLQHIRDQFPGISVSAYQVPWMDTVPPSSVPAEELEKATILVTGSVLPAREQVPNLGYVQLSSAGANHVLNNPLFTDTNIVFCTANGVHGPQISEWVTATYLAFQHHIPKYLEYQREGKWDRAALPVQDSVGRRVGILGYGSIGRQTARVAKALGMDVHAYTLHPRDTPESRRDKAYHPPGLGDPDGNLPSKWFSGGSTADIHAFLGSDLDLLVICLPLTPKTQHLIGAAEFNILSKKKTFVANIARGPIIKTDDLIEALENDTISGAALDVTDPEPLPDGHPLFKTKNVIITPHVSGISTRYNERVLAILELNIGRLLKGEELANRVNRKEGY
ncbi:hypothetical protein jhhlp_008383 [Lomentospora prolificans]|uniref:D-isomer specific 2-hydroxyacid dehydrogenase NAD-binding domain-containing protein n=1 Tax=Lomentospora prolificans TaxID=41688 RepID=A0A2N3MXW9_9PEZI|nr:hypothetical protein jhhlp_008383 [Lomentospora prolificans]